MGELEIRQILNDNNIKYKNEYSFNDLRSETETKLKYDFYLPEHNRLIEFDGEQHFKHQMHGWNNEEHFKQTVTNDCLKNEYSLRNNIPLVRIPYFERGKITLEMLLGDKYLIKKE